MVVCIDGLFGMYSQLATDLLAQLVVTTVFRAFSVGWNVLTAKKFSLVLAGGRSVLCTTGMLLSQSADLIQSVL